MSKLISIIAATFLLSTSANAAGLKLEKLFTSSPRYTTVVIKIDSKMKVKCAVYDDKEKPIRVEHQIVTPPLDEVLIKTGNMTDSVASVQCWPQ